MANTTSNYYADFAKFLRDFTQNFDVKRPETLILFSLSGLVTILAVYLAWLYSRSKQTTDKNGRQTRENSSGAETKEHSDSDKSGQNECPFTWPCDDSSNMSHNEGDVDPKEYCDHIQSEFKRSKHRIAMQKIEKGMSEDQKESEKITQRKQLEAIYKLMEDQQEKFGVDDVAEMQDQMKLYI